MRLISLLTRLVYIRPIDPCSHASDVWMYGLRPPGSDSRALGPADPEEICVMGSLLFLSPSTNQ